MSFFILEVLDLKLHRFFIFTYAIIISLKTSVLDGLDLSFADTDISQDSRRKRGEGGERSLCTY